MEGAFKIMKQLIFGLGLFLVSVSAQAASVLPNLTYILSDHPDAALTSLPTVTYGLRLDQLGGTGAERTFSTTQDGAQTELFWDTSGIEDEVRITGTVSRNSDNSIWNVNYILSDIVSDPLGFTAGSGSGTLSDGVTTINLDGETNSAGFVFLALGDGHRLAGDNTSEVGRGWLLPNGSTDDWLVTLTPVPVPAALPMFFAGLFGLYKFRKKLI